MKISSDKMMNKKKKIEKNQIKTFNLLNVLPDDVLAELGKTCKVHCLEKDEILFLEGEFVQSLFFVLEGWFKTEKISTEGRQITLRFIGPGEVINELAVFSETQTSMSLIAMEDAVVFAVTKAQVDALMENFPIFTRAIITNLSKRIQHLATQVENLSLYGVDVRLARLLLAEAKEGIYDRHSWKTQNEIANRIGSVLDVVNRSLNKLVNQKIIEVTRGEIRITNQNALEEIARE